MAKTKRTKSVKRKVVKSKKMIEYNSFTFLLFLFFVLFSSLFLFMKMFTSY